MTIASTRPPIPFTDDDLKKLKRQMAIPSGSYSACFLNVDEFAALVTRLEAAENVIDAQGHTERCVDEFMKNGCICHFQPAIDEWHKAVGKSKPAVEQTK
jgi:hypothetical protein